MAVAAAEGFHLLSDADCAVPGSQSAELGTLRCAFQKDIEDEGFARSTMQGIQPTLPDPASLPARRLFLHLQGEHLGLFRAMRQLEGMRYRLCQNQARMLSPKGCHLPTECYDCLARIQWRWDGEVSSVPDY